MSSGDPPAGVETRPGPPRARRQQRRETRDQQQQQPAGLRQAAQHAGQTRSAEFAVSASMNAPRDRPGRPSQSRAGSGPCRPGRSRAQVCRARPARRSARAVPQGHRRARCRQRRGNPLTPAPAPVPRSIMSPPRSTGRGRARRRRSRRTARARRGRWVFDPAHPRPAVACGRESSRPAPARPTPAQPQRPRRRRNGRAHVHWNFSPRLGCRAGPIPRAPHGPGNVTKVP